MSTFAAEDLWLTGGKWDGGIVPNTLEYNCTRVPDTGTLLQPRDFDTVYHYAVLYSSTNYHCPRNGPARYI